MISWVFAVWKTVTQDGLIRLCCAAYSWNCLRTLSVSRSRVSNRSLICQPCVQHNINCSLTVVVTVLYNTYCYTSCIACNVKSVVATSRSWDVVGKLQRHVSEQKNITARDIAFDASVSDDSTQTSAARSLQVTIGQMIVGRHQSFCVEHLFLFSIRVI